MVFPVLSLSFSPCSTSPKFLPIAGPPESVQEDCCQERYLNVCLVGEGPSVWEKCVDCKLVCPVQSTLHYSQQISASQLSSVLWCVGRDRSLDYIWWWSQEERSDWWRTGAVWAMTWLGLGHGSTSAVISSQDWQRPAQSLAGDREEIWSSIQWQSFLISHHVITLEDYLQSSPAMFVLSTGSYRPPALFLVQVVQQQAAFKGWG